jgi:23S rRNA (cytosine1962-C5)-methyltransferase
MIRASLYVLLLQAIDIMDNNKIIKNSLPHKREATVRVPLEVARRIRDGHPWIFNDALRGRRLTFKLGQVVEVLDTDGQFVAQVLYDPQGNLVLRVFSRRPGEMLDGDFIHQRVAHCVARRATLSELGPNSCYRLINGDSEGLPAVTVDRYGAFVVVCLFSPVASTYQNDLIAAVVDHLHPEGIYLQQRFHTAEPGRPRPPAELVWGKPAPPEIIVAEGRTRFVVDVSAPTGTGIYPDMRLGREAVARLAGGKRVINCFSYAGAFSVVAAVHGANSVVSVDSAARAHSRARRNFAENNLDAQSNAYEFITGDTFATLARFAERKRYFDLIILDPPTFSSGKGRPFTALKDYAELVATALEIAAPDAIVCAATNAAKMPVEEFDRALGRGANLVGKELLILQQIGQPPDYPVTPAFPEGAYLKFFVAQVI